MSPIKQQVIQMIQSLPEEITIDEIIGELFFKMQADAGLRELDEGKGIPHEDIEDFLRLQLNSKAYSEWLSPENDVYDEVFKGAV